MLDIATVGAGGGSLAWVDDYGALKVGLESAGADPGPICYGRGGTQPTVTDAALVLGRLPGVLIGGAGGMFAAEVADFLDIRRILSPPDPGNLSAFGLHVSDIKRDYVRTLVRQRSGADAGEIDRAWQELERIGRDEVMADHESLVVAVELAAMGARRAVSAFDKHGT